MKTRIEEAAVIHSTQMRGKDFSDVSNNVNFELMKQSFRAGAEFMQKEAEFWEAFVKGLTKDLVFHQNLNKEKFKEIKELEAQLEKAEDEVVLRGEYYNRVKAQNEIMREALNRISEIGYYHDYGDHRKVATEALKKVGEV